MNARIKKLMSIIPNDTCIITSCGYISRDVYRYDRERIFYCQGAMGCALGIGLGLAYSRHDLNVVVISGDGATLMNLGTVALQKYLNLPNLKHYILNNNCYASSGRQETCFKSVRDYLNIDVIPIGKEIAAPRIPLTCKEIKERFMKSINHGKK